MTFTKQDDGGLWVSGPLVGAVVTSMLGLFILIYQFQNDKLWEDGNDITQLKVTATNSSSEAARLEAAISAQSQTLTSILGSMQALKDSNDTLKDQVHGLQTQVSELESALRPLRPNAQ